MKKASNFVVKATDPDNAKNSNNKTWKFGSKRHALDDALFEKELEIYVHALKHSFDISCYVTMDGKPYEIGGFNWDDLPTISFNAFQERIRSNFALTE